MADKIEEKLQEDAVPRLSARRIRCPARRSSRFNFATTRRRRPCPTSECQVRKKVGDIKHTAGAEACRPFLDAEYGGVYVAVYAFTGADYTPAELKRTRRGLPPAALLGEGCETRSFWSSCGRKSLRRSSRNVSSQLSVSAPQQVFDKLAAAKRGHPGRQCRDTPTDRVYVRGRKGRSRRWRRYRAVPVSRRASEGVSRSGDIADVRRGYRDPPTFTVRHGNEAGGRSRSVDAPRAEACCALGHNLDAELQAIAAGLPAGVEVEQVAFQPHVVDESVGEFTRSFVEALRYRSGRQFPLARLAHGVVVAAPACRSVPWQSRLS